MRLTPTRARAMSRDINRLARDAGWRPCAVTGEDHRYGTAVDGHVTCAACGQFALPSVATDAPDLYPTTRKG